MAHSCLQLVSRLMRALTLKQTAVLRVIKPDNELNNAPQLHTAEGKCSLITITIIICEFLTITAISHKNSCKFYDQFLENQVQIRVISGCEHSKLLSEALHA